jgi:hypothetical protein
VDAKHTCYLNLLSQRGGRPFLFVMVNLTARAESLRCPKSSWDCVPLRQAAQVVAWGPFVVSEHNDNDNDREPIPVRMVASRLEDPNTTRQGRHGKVEMFVPIQ